MKETTPCTLRLTFYLPSAFRLEHFYKKLIINYLTFNPKTIFFVVPVERITRCDKTLVCMLNRLERVAEGAIVARIFALIIVVWDEPVNGFAIEGAMILVGCNLKLHSVEFLR